MRKTARKVEPKKSLWERYRSLWLLLIKLAIVILVVWLGLFFIVGIFPVHGNFMYPMLKDGDLAITLKLGGYERGQVVAYEVDGGTRFARIVALNGDAVLIDEQYTINGQQPYEEVFYATEYSTPINVSMNGNQVYLLNDYRENMGDSRSYGPITTDNLKGHVIFMFRWRSF